MGCIKRPGRVITKMEDLVDLSEELIRECRAGGSVDGQRAGARPL